MAFPTIVSTQTSYNIESTNHSITLPSNIASGNILIAFFTCDGTGLITIAENAADGWNILSSYSNTGNGAICLYKIANGNDTLYLLTEGSETSTSIVYNISGASTGIPVNEYNGGSSNNAYPQVVMPINGTQDYLFLVYAGIEGDIIASAAPTNFSGLITIQSDTNGSSSSSAYRQYNTGSSYAPSTFTSASANWVTFTICISPYSVDGIGISNIGIYNA